MPSLKDHQRPRQRPVSCQFCRTRKLRCSRVAPCTNCVSRGIKCELEIPSRNSPVAPSASDAELLERIRKLEALLESQKSVRNELGTDGPESSNTQTHGSPLPPQIENLDNDVAWLESIYRSQDPSVSFSV